MCVCVCVCLDHHYLHLDLHTAVGELLNHALDPYERLYLSEGEIERQREAEGERERGRVNKVRGARAQSLAATL